jgi:hypothetical protein
MATDFSKYGSATTSATAPVAANFSKYGSPVAQQASTAPQSTPAETIWSQLASYAGGVKNAFNQGVGQAADAINEIGTPSNQNPIVRGVEKGLKLESGVASAVTSPLAPLLAPVGKAVQAYSDFASSDQNPFVKYSPGGEKGLQDFANSPTSEATSRVAEDLSNAGNVAGTILGVDQAVKVPKTVGNAANALKTDYNKTYGQPAPAITADHPEVLKVAQEWKAPSEINNTSYNKARGVLDKSPDVPSFLAEQGIAPFQHVEDGKFLTTDTAEALRDTAGKLSRETLRPSLQMADYTTPKTPVKALSISDDLIQAQGKGVTPDDMEAIRGIIAKKLDALTRKHEEGMSLENLHDERITYAQNGKFSPVADNATDNNAIANRSIATALNDALDKAAPSDVPVKDFRSYLSKYYKAADYLDALNGKKAPVSTAQSIARFGAKFGGAAMARFLVPGGGELISTFAGYQIGKALEHALENATNPMRDAFLRNLQKTNPEAHTKLLEYLQNAKAGNPATPRLPEASFIPLSAPK